MSSEDVPSLCRRDRPKRKCAIVAQQALAPKRSRNDDTIVTASGPPPTDMTVQDGDEEVETEVTLDNEMGARPHNIEENGEHAASPPTQPQPSPVFHPEERELDPPSPTTTDTSINDLSRFTDPEQSPLPHRDESTSSNSDSYDSGGYLKNILNLYIPK